MSEYSFSCPRCGSYDLRRSRAQSISELPSMLLGIYPFRCLACGDRFFGNVLATSSSEFVTCPKCLRLNVESCNLREADSQWDQILSLLGASLFRCTVCRAVFTSFRKELHPAVKGKRYLLAAGSAAPAHVVAHAAPRQDTMHPVEVK